MQMVLFVRFCQCGRKLNIEEVKKDNKLCDKCAEKWFIIDKYNDKIESVYKTETDANEALKKYTEKTFRYDKNVISGKDLIILQQKGK
jgi:uncharacterized protein YfcZ (UPF0381/DUF406 family)